MTSRDQAWIWPALLGTTLRVLLALTAWYVRGVDAFVTPDSATYLDLSASLVNRQAFADVTGHPEFFRAPGYPVLLAIGQWMGTAVWFALAANLALTVLTVALVFHTVSRLAADDRVARVAAWAVALEPTMLVWSLKVLSETLFTTCLAASVAAGIGALEHGRGRWTIAAAVALAASVYVRPMAYPLVPLMAVVLAWATSGCWVTRSRHAAMLLVTCAVLVAPWHLRNWLAAGYAGFSTGAERALVISVGGSIDARRGGQPFTEIRRRLLDRLVAADHVRGRQTSAVMRREAWRTLAHDPLLYVEFHCQGILRTILDPAAVEYMRILGRYPDSGGFLGRALDEGMPAAILTLSRRYPETVSASVVLAVVSVPYLLGPIVAWRRLNARTRGPFLLLGATAAYLLIAGGGVPGYSRFRAPAMPLLVMMTACAWGPRPEVLVLPVTRAPG